MVIGGGGLGLARTESFPRPPEGTWHHYIFVLDNSTANGDITAYVDEVPQSTSIIDNDKGSGGNISSQLLTMMSYASRNFFGSGKLDDVRIYNRALSAAEVKQLYKLGTVIISQ